MPRLSRLLPPLVAVTALLALAAAAGGQVAERIDTVAGSGNGGFGGDGGPAVAALLTAPSDVAVLPGGGLLIADTSNHRIRRVSAQGVIATVAGAGPCCGAPGAFAGDGLGATDAAVRLDQPRGVAPTADGGFLIADTGNDAIRRVSPAGVITTVAGIGGRSGFAGNGGPATRALLFAPGGVAPLPGGGLLIADTGNDRIRRVSPQGVITTVAGGASAGFAGDGGPATRALLNAPARVAPLPGGGFLIADTGNDRIRRVDAAGRIATVAGGSVAGFGGDGGPATAALLNAPEGVATRADGAILVADSVNERVREIGTDGIIRTVAGTGTLGFSGDGGPPATAQLSHPRAVAQSAAGVWIADAFNHRVRMVAPAPVPPPSPPAPEPAPPAPPPDPPPGVSPPVLGHSLVAGSVAGRVRVRLRGTARFVTLRSVTNIPLGSELDATHGSVAVFFVTTPAGRGASALVRGGRFVLRQPARRGRARRPGVLVLSGPLRGCRTAARAQAARRRHRHRRRKGRRLRVHANGAIKTTGRYGSAIVRGTRWTIVDRCPRARRAGTLIAVSEGVVAVRDFARRRTVRVPAGRRYLARARRA